MNNMSYNKIFQVKYYISEDKEIEESVNVESNFDLFKQKIVQIFNINKNMLDKLDFFVVNNENERNLISNNEEYMDIININEFLINIEIKKKEILNNSNNETLLELVDNMKLPNFENIENIPNETNNFLENSKFNIKKIESKEINNNNNNNNENENNNNIISNKIEEVNNKQIEIIDTKINEKVNQIIEKNNLKIINLINENVNKKFESLYDFLENKFKTIIENIVDKKANDSLKNINENLNDLKNNIENVKKDINNNIENKFKVNKDSILINEENERSESFYNYQNPKNNYIKKKNNNKYNNSYNYNFNNNYRNKNNNYKYYEKKDNNNEKLNQIEDEKEIVNENNEQIEPEKNNKNEDNNINENNKEINIKDDDNNQYSVEFPECTIFLKTLIKQNYTWSIKIKNNGNEDWPKNCVLCCAKNNEENGFYFVDTEIYEGNSLKKGKYKFVQIKIVPPKKIDDKTDFYFINYEVRLKGEEPLIKDQNNIGTICLSVKN